MLCHPRKNGGNRCIILNVNYVVKSFTFNLSIRSPKIGRDAPPLGYELREMVQNFLRFP
ncbi:hypothetical protein CPL00124_CDS0163 [Escherchia phage Stokescottia]